MFKAVIGAWGNIRMEIPMDLVKNMLSSDSADEQKRGLDVLEVLILNNLLKSEHQTTHREAANSINRSGRSSINFKIIGQSLRRDPLQKSYFRILERFDQEIQGTGQER